MKYIAGYGSGLSARSHKPGIGGSNPSPATKGLLVQLARTSDLHSEGHRFESGRGPFFIIFCPGIVEILPINKKSIQKEKKQPRGPMVKALDYESRDCMFDSCRGLISSLELFWKLRSCFW